MRTRAAVALEAGKPLEVMEVNLAGPKAGEVMVEIKATGICHTDEFTLSGADPEGLFEPYVSGREGGTGEARAALDHPVHEAMEAAGEPVEGRRGADGRRGAGLPPNSLPVPPILAPRVAQQSLC